MQLKIRDEIINVSDDVDAEDLEYAQDQADEANETRKSALAEADPELHE